jgi:outer membrane protein OmpU
VATAGVAAADVTITGSAEMGIAGGSVSGGVDPNTTFFQTVDVRFTMSGEADNGLSFGAVIDLDDAGGTEDVAGAFADYTVFIAGDFGRLTMGDTDGALDWAITETANLGNPGTIADDETGHAGYLSNGVFDSGAAGNLGYNGQVLRYDYSIGDFGVAVSAQVDGDNTRDGDANLQVGFRYGMDFAGGNVNFGLGYSVVGDRDSFTAGDQGYDATAVSAAVSLDSGFGFVITYAAINDDGIFGGDGEHIGVGVDYTFDAFTIHANWGEYDWDTTAAVEDSDGWGLAMAYDFGGGLSAHFGYGSSSYGAQNAAGATTLDSDSFSLGLAMAF